MNCLKCLKNFIPHPVTGNCWYCGGEQDLEHIEYVRIKKLLHEATGHNPQSDGSDKDYPLRKKWSMKD